MGVKSPTSRHWRRSSLSRGHSKLLEGSRKQLLPRWIPAHLVACSQWTRPPDRHASGTNSYCAVAPRKPPKNQSNDHCQRPVLGRMSLESYSYQPIRDFYVTTSTMAQSDAGIGQLRETREYKLYQETLAMPRPVPRVIRPSLFWHAARRDCGDRFGGELPDPGSPWNKCSAGLVFGRAMHQQSSTT